MSTPNQAYLCPSLSWRSFVRAWRHASMMNDVTNVKCCSAAGLSAQAYALSRASIAYRALISVCPVVLAHEDPECISRIVLCGFMEWCVAKQPQRLCCAVSKGGTCKDTAILRGLILQTCRTVYI